MKNCIDCKNYIGGDLCETTKNGISFIDGKGKVLFATTARRRDDMCGLDAKNFVPKRPWWKFWKTRGADIA